MVEHQSHVHWAIDPETKKEEVETKSYNPGIEFEVEYEYIKNRDNQAWAGAHPEVWRQLVESHKDYMNLLKHFKQDPTELIPAEVRSLMNWIETGLDQAEREWEEENGD